MLQHSLVLSLMKTNNQQVSNRLKAKHQVLPYHLNSNTAKIGDKCSVALAEAVASEEAAEPEEEATSRTLLTNSFLWPSNMLRTWAHKKTLKKKKRKNVVEDTTEEPDNGVKREPFSVNILKNPLKEIPVNTLSPKLKFKIQLNGLGREDVSLDSI